ncbi:hypothetical protein Taro_011021 [Colocasia esculenta]|uniref:Uncharacterized protein n=1 Tax=Colocasia esculenta TaxID=4460 RepID=A0A843U9U7_COLES|nr:hypothetical protein [Colocasia esculenta]
MGPAAVLSELASKGWSFTVGVQVHGRLHHELDGSSCGRLCWWCMWATRGLTPTCQFTRLYVHPRAALSAHPLSLLPQLRALVFLKVLTGIEEWLVDRGTRGVAELREETSRRGAIRVGARGGLGGLRPGNLASTSFAAKIFSQEVDGQGPCRLLPVSGIEEWLVDRGTRGVTELREETSRRGAIRVGARGGLGGLRPGNLASTSFAAKIFSQEVDGQGPCRLLPVRARRTFPVRHPVLGRVVAEQGQYLQRSSTSAV